ncbi:uroporphyrinogen decarboxylase family protein [Lutispora saccharofermentans]|uniref:Uroporphyrinogen decarboxylase n=1 Tax=Lutispora saccharofermentans TaxID=3024236 RepID=A0ABT1NKG7_9FIRM|nr:uroporphyrinogen decarboxylase family protein [Lutispora saccharofermentans]MCQ1531755.1 uroporphyrinogen decarboxylase [Lutispora saccharofermentans]
MTKTERIKAAIEGRQTDSIPYAFWTHLPGIDMDPSALADATFDFYKKYDIDFIKTMNNGMYPIEDLGCTIDYSDIVSGGVAKLIDTPVKSIDDWENVKVTSIDQGALKRELTSLSLLIEKTKGEVPVIFTVFSPITTADKISNKYLTEHIKNGGGSKVHKALEAITQTTCQLVKRAIGIGADGIFFASQMSSYDIMSEELYKEYGVYYDERVITASKGWFNVLHAHGENIMFNLLKNYPVNVFNWHVWESLPKLEEANFLAHKCVMGGIKRMDITNRNKNELQNQIYECVKALKGRGHILTPGCVIRYPIDEEILKYVKQVKYEIEEAVLKKEVV